MGKVTVKHFLNKKLKPIYNGYVKELLDTPYYPLYIRVTAQRQTTELKSRAFEQDKANVLIDEEDRMLQLFNRSLYFEMPPNYFSEDEFERLNNEYFKFIHREKKILTEIVEDILLKDPVFTIKILNTIYDHELKSVMSILSDYFKREVGMICIQSNYLDVYYLFNTNLNFGQIHKILLSITQGKKECSDFINVYLEKAKYIISAYQYFTQYHSNYLSFFEWKKYNYTEKFYSYIKGEFEESYLYGVMEIFSKALNEYDNFAQGS